MRLTHHATPRAYFEALDPSEPYLPPAFDADGFIHCTDSAAALPGVLTTYCRDVPGDWIVLTIDMARVTSEVRYEDHDAVFPHIYGPLNRDAIIEVCPIRRDPDGSFLPLATK